MNYSDYVAGKGSTARPNERGDGAKRKPALSPAIDGPQSSRVTSSPQLLTANQLRAALKEFPAASRVLISPDGWGEWVITGLEAGPLGAVYLKCKSIDIPEHTIIEMAQTRKGTFAKTVMVDA